LTITLTLFCLTATLLLLHEIESAFEKEWEILKLPGKIGGFMVLHIPVILLLFYGLVETYKRSMAGSVLGIVVGIGGLIPFLVHEILVHRKGHFERLSSRIVTFSCSLTAIALMCVSIIDLVHVSS
jgi:hypothetical protein